MSLDDHPPDMAGDACRQAGEEMTDTVTPRWQRPQISRISLEQTLALGGTYIDGTLGQNRK